MERETLANIIITDYPAAVEKGTEAQLWKQHHYQRISGFRADIAQAKKDRNSAQLIAATALFRAFLDDAMVFYSMLIVRLAAAHDLKTVKQLMASSSLGLPSPSFPSVHVIPVENKAIIVLTCFQCLIYLGDLARYRDSTTPNPSPLPKHYYTLAHQLLPTSGNPFNQLAVLPATTAGDLMPAELYVRALCCHRPFITARKNLEVCLSKVRSVEGSDGVLEACRVLLLGASSGAKLGLEWSEDFENKIQTPLLSSFELIFGTRTYNPDILERNARLLVGVSELIISSSSTTNPNEVRIHSAFCLISNLIQLAIQTGTTRILKVHSDGCAVYGYRNAAIAIADLISLLRILCLHVLKQTSQTGTCPLVVNSVDFWELVATFCNCVQEVVNDKYLKNQFSVAPGSMLDTELIGFSAVDDRSFELNELGEFDKASVLKENEDEMETDEDEDEADSGIHLKIVHVLRCFYQLSLVDNVPITFTGTEWRLADGSDSVEPSQNSASSKSKSKSGSQCNDISTSTPISERTHIKGLSSSLPHSTCSEIQIDEKPKPDKKQFVIGQHFFMNDLRVVAERSGHHYQPAGLVPPSEGVVERVRLTLSNSTLTELDATEDDVITLILSMLKTDTTRYKDLSQDPGVSMEPPRWSSRPRTTKLSRPAASQISSKLVSVNPLSKSKRIIKTHKTNQRKGGKKTLFATKNSTSNVSCTSKKRLPLKRIRKNAVVVSVAVEEPLPESNSNTFLFDQDNNEITTQHMESNSTSMMVSSPIDASGPGCSPTLHVKRQFGNIFKHQHQPNQPSSRAASFFNSLRSSSLASSAAAAPVSMKQGPIKSRLRYSKLHQLDTPITGITVPSLCGSMTPERGRTSTGGLSMMMLTDATTLGTCATSVFTSMDMDASHTTPNTKRILQEFEVGKRIRAKEDDVNPFLLASYQD
ncbi:UNVERIFIED_CONTAM: hypothetical protein HDU68_011864 [Siphonaria sp. JEL0065]|nr:hypothetical protein HDU68_011864 [Siphonaria sp. JEL0065]